MLYFGYADISSFGFVGAGFLVVMAASVAFALVYFVGAVRGRTAALRYVTSVTYGLVAASAADLAYGGATGDIAAFLRAYGWGPLAEMVVLAGMCVGSLWFMAVAYANSKREE